MSGQTRFGANADDDFQGIGGFDIAQGKAHAARQNLNDLLVGIFFFFRQQPAFTVVDGGADDVGGLGQSDFGLFAQGAVRHAGNHDRGFDHQRLFGNARA